MTTGLSDPFSTLWSRLSVSAVPWAQNAPLEAPLLSVGLWVEFKLSRPPRDLLTGCAFPSGLHCVLRLVL